MTEKRALRASIRAARATRATRTLQTPGAAQAEERQGAADERALTTHLAELSSQTGARRVCCFVSVRGEPETAGYLAWAHANGIEVLLPRVATEDRLGWALHAPGNLRPGAFNIPEPTGPDEPEGAAGADLLLIPAAAVDRGGGRLGWGRGFYDRELAALGPAAPPVFAVVFEEEVLERVPTEPHDIPVSGAVTERGIHRFG